MAPDDGARRSPLQDRLAAVPPLLGRLLGRQLRLGQLALAVVALTIMCSGETGIFARFLVPAAALQCAWSAVAAIVNADWNQQRTRVLSWTHWAYLVLDMVTCFVTFMAASGSLGLGYHIAVDRCALEPVRCPVIKRVWPKALLAWLALQPAAIYFAFVEFFACAAFTAVACERELPAADRPCQQ